MQISNITIDVIKFVDINILKDCDKEVDYLQRCLKLYTKRHVDTGFNFK